MADEQGGKRIASWSELFEKMAEVGIGAMALTAESAQKLVNELVAQGQVAKEESATLAERLLAMGRRQQEMVRESVDKAVDAAITRMTLVREADLDDLRRRIAALEQATGCVPPPPPLPPVTDTDFQVDQE